MSMSFECKRGGVSCRAKITGATEDEVLNKAVEHAKKAHAIDLTQSRTLVNYAKSLVRDESGGAPGSV